MWCSGILAEAEKCIGSALLRKASARLVPADIVAAALEEDHINWTGELALERFKQSRHVAANDLGLKSQRRGRHDGRLVVIECMRNERDQIGQRLTRPGPGLHQQVIPCGQRLRDPLCHLMLTRTVFTAHGCDCCIKEFQRPSGTAVRHAGETPPDRQRDLRGP